MRTFAPLSQLGQAALKYSAEDGWGVFPLIPRTKFPFKGSRGFEDASSHPEQIAAWWDEHPDANIGFRPGSADLIVLDIDGPDAEAKARELGMFDVVTLAVRTARGQHLYFRLPKGVTVGNASTFDKLGINVRSASGYVLLPPSVHESGHVYEWIGAVE